MSSCVRSLALLLGLAPVFAQSADLVAITRDPGYPSPGSTSEVTYFVVASNADATDEQVAAMNAYFSSVRKILAEAPVPTDCCVPAIDAPFVKIDISLDGIVYKLQLTEGGAGLVMSLDPSADERRTASVMQRVLKLSDESKAKSPH
jgi:hypothetical protein